MINERNIDLALVVAIFIALIGYYTNQFLIGLSAAIGIVILVIARLTIEAKRLTEEAKIVSEQIGDKYPIQDAMPLANFEAMKPTILKIRIKNILETFGIRLRFRSMDYINPRSLDLTLEPGQETQEEIVIIPLGRGKREFSVTYAQLYDAEGNLIPSEIADDIDQQKFAYYAQEPAFGLTSRQRSILSALIKFAVFLSASSLIYLSMLQTSGFEFAVYMITRVIPLLTILQVPVLMLLFYLDKQFPEKPSFKFEEVLKE